MVQEPGLTSMLAKPPSSLPSAACSYYSIYSLNGPSDMSSKADSKTFEIPPDLILTYLLSSEEHV